MEHYRLLDCERIEDVILCWMQVALGDPSRDNEDDFDLRLKASYAVPERIGIRQRIILASRPERTSAREGDTNVLLLLQSALAGTQDYSALQRLCFSRVDERIPPNFRMLLR